MINELILSIHLHLSQCERKAKRFTSFFILLTNTHRTPKSKQRDGLKDKIEY